MTENPVVPKTGLGLMMVPFDMPFTFCCCGSGTAADPYHLADHEWTDEGGTKHVYCCGHFSHPGNHRLLPGRSCRFGPRQTDRRRGDRRDMVNRRAFMDRRSV